MSSRSSAVTKVSTSSRLIACETLRSRWRASLNSSSEPPLACAVPSVWSAFVLCSAASALCSSRLKNLSPLPKIVGSENMGRLHDGETGRGLRPDAGHSMTVSFQPHDSGPTALGAPCGSAVVGGLLWEGLLWEGCCGRGFSPDALGEWHRG